MTSFSPASPASPFLIPYSLLPLASCLLPIASCLLPLAFCLLPIAYCLLPLAFRYNSQFSSVQQKINSNTRQRSILGSKKPFMKPTDCLGYNVIRLFGYHFFKRLPGRKSRNSRFRNCHRLARTWVTPFPCFAMSGFK